MSKCRNLHQPTTNWRVALSIIVWPYSVTALWDCWVGQKGEGLVRILFWFLFLTHTHTHTPAFQKLSHPRCLIDQCDFYLHVKLQLCGIEIPAFRVATISGYDWYHKLIFSFSTVQLVHHHFSHNAMKIWHRDCLPLWDCGEGGVWAASRHSLQGEWRCSHWVPLAIKHIAQR